MALGAGAGAAIGGIGGSIGGGVFSAISAHKNRVFQKEMYNTRYQRTVKDMEAAGLNPMLAYSQGVSGASPSGSMAATPDFSSGISTAFRGAREQEMQNITRKTAKTHERMAHWKELSALYESNRGYYDSVSAQHQSRIVGAGVQEALNRESVQNTGYGKKMHYLNMALPAIGAATSAIGVGVARKLYKKTVSRRR